MKQELIILSLLLLVSFPAVRALLQPGGFTSHDLTHHVIRQISMDKLLSEGQFPPRWSADLNNGYGYPVFLFNYPLPAMLGEIFYKLGFGFVYSVKAVLFISMIFSILGMYFFLRSLLGSKLAAFLGAVFYLYAPIRFIYIYVSAAVGSALAGAIVPFVFWSLAGIFKNKKWAPFLGALSFAGLILAHNVTALIFTPFILIFAGFLLWKSENRLRVFKKLVIMFILGVGLSSWFWMPAVFEKQYTRFDLIFTNFYREQFMTLWQLIHSPWGYGLSHPQKPEDGDMSYQIGLAHIGIMLMYGFWFVTKRKKIKEKAIGIFALATFLFSVFLMFKISLPVWDKLPFLSLIQFPQRLQSLSIFVASMAAALLIKELPYRKILFVLLIILVIYANRNHWHINEKFDPGEDYYLNLKTTSTSYGEHLPKWGRLMEKPSPGKLQFIKGGGNIKLMENKQIYVLAEIEATVSSKLRFNQIYFPGWQIEVDGESYGLPIFDIDVGKHQISAEFKNTPVRNLADGISVASVVLWLILLCKLLIRK